MNYKRIFIAIKRIKILPYIDILLGLGTTKGPMKVSSIKITHLQVLSSALVWKQRHSCLNRCTPNRL